MKKSTKAALFSGLLFPGAGHFFLRRFAAGGAFLCVTLVSLVLLVKGPLQAAMAIVDKIESGEVAFDLDTINTLAATALSGDVMLMARGATFVLTVCWLAGIVDSWRIGRMQDQPGA